MKFQYLAITESKNCFCEDHFAFNRLLLVNSKVSIISNSLIFKDNNIKIETEYDIFSNDIKELYQKYFNVSVTLKSENKTTNEVDIDRLNIIRKLIATNLRQISSKVSINTLWDDISLYYSNKAYPYIAKIENLMRKLIMDQMLIKFGMNWYDERMPNEVKELISKKRILVRIYYLKILYMKLILYIYLNFFLNNID